MRRSILVLVVLGGGAAFAQKPAVTVEPAGMSLIWNKGGKAFENAMVLNGSDYVSLALLAQAEGKKIVALDEEGSKVTLLSDDQGTKLSPSLGHFPKIAEDGSGLMIEVVAGERVSGKAQALVAKGALKITLASKTETKRSKLVAAAKGTKVEIADDLVFEITEAGKPDWGDDPMAVTLSIKRDISDVAEVRFLDSDGKPVESSQAGSSRSGFFGKVTVTRDYNLKRKVDKVTIEVDRWTDLEEVTAPFDLKVGIGGMK